MCEFCDAEAARGDRPVQPITLVTKSPELADALVTILVANESGLRDEDGQLREDGNAYAEGNVLTIPFAGNPAFLNYVAQLVEITAVAEHAEAQAMIDRTEADLLGVTPAEIRDRKARERAEQEPGDGIPADVPPEVRDLLAAFGGGRAFRI